MANPWQFNDIPSLHSETQLYTSKRSNADSPAEYKFKVEDLHAFLIANFSFSGKQTHSITSSGVINIPAGMLMDVLVISSATTQDITIDVAGDVMINNESVAAGSDTVLRIDTYGGTSGLTINVTCDNSLTIISYIK